MNLHHVMSRWHLRQHGKLGTSPEAWCNILSSKRVRWDKVNLQEIALEHKVWAKVTLMHNDGQRVET